MEGTGSLYGAETPRPPPRAVSRFGYHACDELVRLATYLPCLPLGRLAQPGAAEDP